MDLTARNATQLLLINIDGAAGTSTKAAGTYIRSYTDLTDGMLAVTDPKGLSIAHTGGTLNGLFKIVVRNGNYLYWTPVLSAARSTTYPYVSYVRGKYYTAPVPQIDYIGYNYVAGTGIEVINSNYYKVWIHTKGASAMEQGSAIVKDGVYESTASDAESNIAYELTQSLINNWKREPWKDIYFDRTYQGAVTRYVWAGDWLTFAVTQGSPYITADEAFTVTAGVAVGTILSLAGLAYIVTEVVSTTVVKLDIPWQHKSGYVCWKDTGAGTCVVTNGNATCTLSVAMDAPAVTAGTRIFLDINGRFHEATMTAVTTVCTLAMPYQHTTDGVAVLTAGGTAAAASRWGIRLEGAPRTDYFVVGKIPYSQPTWEVFIEDFGSTTITNSVAASLGTGTGYQIAEQELFCQGFEKGNFTDQKDFLNTNRAKAVVTNNYDMLTLQVKDEKTVSSIIGNPISPTEIVIAANHGTASASIAAIAAILDDYLGTITIDA